MNGVSESEGMVSFMRRPPPTPSYEQQFLQSMVDAGIDFKGPIIADGEIHRFAPIGKRERDGWYVFFGLAGVFGDWSQGIRELWSLKGNGIAPSNTEEIQVHIQNAKRRAAEEMLRKQEEVSITALALWEASSSTVQSPYLERKKVDALGVRFEGSNLIVPLRDISGKLWSLQTIHPDGTKRFLAGGRKTGCFHLIGSPKAGGPLYVAEGYATGASLHRATGNPVAIAFDAGNLEPVVEALTKAYSQTSLILAGDEDQWKDKNVGRKTAEEVAKKYGCSVVFPTFKNTATYPTDFNDLHVLEGLEEVKRQLDLSASLTTLKALNVRDLLSLDIPPREMILSPILPEQGLTMIHAPRGIGKTHVSLMIAYAVATGGSVFNGKWQTNTPRKVLFVDGEMPLVVMQERLAKIVNSTEADSIKDDNLLIITPDMQNQGISDLSTLEGQRSIEEHLKDVKLLILDNHSALCRRGRENESESWIPLQEWFLTLRRRGISVLLIHHSNKAGGQRGTSRKEDLLDTVITLRKPESYDPKEGARFEVHYEKARGFHGEEAAPFEAALKEDNGKFIWTVQSIENIQLDQILSLHKEGLTQREIAEELGLGLGTVNRKLKEGKERKIQNDADE
jgi:putative DNA primase/helicase